MLVSALLVTASSTPQSPLSTGSGEPKELLQHTYTISCESEVDPECNVSLEWISSNKSLESETLIIDIKVPLLYLKTATVFDGL